MKISVIGASGRMGQEVVRLAISCQISISGAVVSRKSPSLGMDVGEVAKAGSIGVFCESDISAALLGSTVAIDFSTSDVLFALLERAVKQKVPVVSGTTRLSEKCLTKLKDASKEIPVLWSPNMSIGVSILKKMVAQAIEMLGPEFDVEITETHHRNKSDSPSGTAMDIAKTVKQICTDAHFLFGREGNLGKRNENEVAILSIRGGDVIGDHSVHFLGNGERLEFTHRATNRELFARGALKVAEWIQNQPPRLYSMEDFLDNRSE